MCNSVRFHTLSINVVNTYLHKYSDKLRNRRHFVTMESNLDIILLGATGFTGKLAAKNLGEIVKKAEYADLRWGIAGRSMKKLQDLLAELEDLEVDTSNLGIFECDIGKEGALPELTKKAKVLMNATGPYSILSAPVVMACINTGTHYVDISAESYVKSGELDINGMDFGQTKAWILGIMPVLYNVPSFMKKGLGPYIIKHMLTIYRDYNKAAEEANVLIVPGCGFSCLPVTVGLIDLERNFKGTLQIVECYTTLEPPLRANLICPGYNNSLVHYGTWASFVYELQNYRRYNTLRKQTFPELEAPPAELKKSFFHRHKGRFWFPYPAPDSAVVEHTQLYRKEKGETPYHFKIYATMPFFIHFLIIVPMFFFYYIMCYFACFKKLLWTFPKFFTAGLMSHKGPSEKMRSETKYNFIFNGKGWSSKGETKSAPDKSLTVKISGHDAYQTTAFTFVSAAITILKEKSKMPKGGVLPTGVAFNDTQIDVLFKNNGMKFDVIESF